MAPLAEVSRWCIKSWEWDFWVRCKLSIVIQGTDLCNVFMFQEIGEARECVCIPEAESWHPEKKKKKGSLPPFRIQTGGLGHRTAHRKFMFAKRAPWDFPALPAWPLLHPCSTLTSISLFCKIIVVSAGFYWLLNSLKKLEEKGKIRLI